MTHILAAYHRPLDEELPRLEGMARKVLEVHREKEPEMLPELLSVYLGLKAELEQHMRKEEHILFPMILSVARVYYGEFGAPEPVAVLDTIGVHPDFRKRGVGLALLGQLRTNLLGLGIPTLQTEVSWSNPELLTFFQHEGFLPAPRFCLDLDLKKTRRD